MTIGNKCECSPNVWKGFNDPQTVASEVVTNLVK